MILKRIAGVEAKQSALGVLPVERALRPPQHVYTVELISVEVVGRLADNGQSVHVKPHSWIIDARTDATHIDR